MRHPGIDDHGIGGLLGAESKTVCRDHSRRRPCEAEIFSRPGGKDGVDLDRCNLSGETDDLGQDGAVIAGAGADVNDMRPRPQVSRS